MRTKGFHQGRKLLTNVLYCKCARAAQGSEKNKSDFESVRWKGRTDGPSLVLASYYPYCTECYKPDRVLRAPHSTRNCALVYSVQYPLEPLPTCCTICPFEKRPLVS